MLVSDTVIFLYELVVSCAFDMRMVRVQFTPPETMVCGGDVRARGEMVVFFSFYLHFHNKFYFLYNLEV